MTLAIDLPIGPMSTGIPIATASDAGAINGIWSMEVAHDPYLALVGPVTSSTRISVGTAITVAFPRSPMVHAQAAWDLQHMSHGRFILGLGAQVKAHNERRYGVPGDQPVARLQDMVRAIRAIWHAWQDGTTLHYTGEFYTHTLMTPFFNPGPLKLEHPYPPIYLAAVSKAMIAMACREADGIHVHPLHTKRFLAEYLVPEIAVGAAERHDQVTTALCVSAMIATGNSAEEIEQQREFYREQIAFYGSTPAYAHVLADEGKGDIAEELHRLSVKQEWKAMKACVDDDLLNAVCVSASWDDLPKALIDRYGDVAERVVPYVASDIDAWNQVAATVLQMSA